MASQERSLCSLKDLLSNQNAREKKKKDTTKQPNMQRRGFSISRCSFIRLKNSRIHKSNREEIFIAIVNVSVLGLEQTKTLQNILYGIWIAAENIPIYCANGFMAVNGFYSSSLYKGHTTYAMRRNITALALRRNRGNRAGWQQERDWTRRKRGRFVKVKNCFCRQRRYEISPLRCCSDAAPFPAV